MALKLRWSPEAVADLEAICNLIADDSPEYAQIFAQRIFEKMDAVRAFPHVGRVVPEYANDNLREIFHLDYRIVYRINPENIELVTISHGARKLPDSLD